ncbi:DAK2 domain-containing protein, partial [Salinispira pacifica]
MDHRVHDNSPAPLAAIDGTTLVAMMAAGLDRLDARVADIDRLNLFPVPDRDTGTNMVQTLRASVNGLITIPGNAAEAAGLIARQGLYAARGNSGVILAQFMRGFADATGERITLDTAALARAVSGGAKAAWEAVDVPVEGTVLTVMRSAAEAASAAARRGEAVDRLLQSALYAAVRALEQTREQLPTLARAGVVDAGGAGFVLILEGMTAHLSPDLPIETASLFTSAPPDVGAETGTAPYGFCTEFLITGSSVDAASVRSVIA